MFIFRDHQTITYSNGLDTVFVYQHGQAAPQTFALKNSNKFLWGIFDGVRNEAEILSQLSYFLGKTALEVEEEFMNALIFFKTHKLIRIQDDV